MSEEESFLKNWKVIGIVFFAIVVVLIYNGVSDSIYKTKGNISRPIGISPNITLTPNSTESIKNITGETGEAITSNNTDQNKFFRDSISQNYAVLFSDINCITNAAKNRNITDTAKCGKFLNEDANRILGKMNELNVSSPLQAKVVDEFKKSLEKYSTGGEKLYIGATKDDFTQMDEASSYISDGTIGINDIEKMLYPNDSIKPKIN